MKQKSRGVAHSSLSMLAAAGLTVLLIVVSLAATACGTDADSSATMTTTDAGSTTTTGTASSATVTIRDTGMTTTSTPLASVPTLASGITPEQALQLVASQSNVPAEDWELRDCTNLGDWAVANLYTSHLSEQMDERGVTAVFEKRGDAWFQAGWVSVSDPSYQQVVELTNMGASEEVWSYFGLAAGQETYGRLVPPEQMPADFGFVAAFGVMGRNTIDTLEGTFAKDLGPNEEPVTTELSLPPEALETLYRDLVLIQNQWQVFTTAFAPDPDPTNTGTSMYVSPYYTYRLEWRAAGFSSLPIVWEDSALSPDPKAAALRAWFKKLQQMIEATPEWKALPSMKGGYM